jgi:hypothetical protein
MISTVHRDIYGRLPEKYSVERPGAWTRPFAPSAVLRGNHAPCEPVVALDNDILWSAVAHCKHSKLTLRYGLISVTLWPSYRPCRPY